MHRPITQRRAVRRVLAAGAVVALSSIVATSSTTAAAPSVTVATSVVYGIDGPDTPLPLSITLGNESAAVIVTAGGLVAAALCSGPYVATVDFGEVTITHDTDPTVPASTVVGCDLELELGTSGLNTVDLVVSERDAFNVELGTSTTAISLEGITVTAAVGDVALTGGTYVAAEPRSVGDELSRTVTFGLPSVRAITVTAPADTTLSGCPATTADNAVCDLSRVLSLADLAAGTAPVAPTLLVDGWPVATPAADVDVPSERRLTIDATAVASVVRAGEIVTVDATVTNLGTIDLGALALGGAGFTVEAATCGADPIASVTLAPGDSATCRIARRVTTADVGAATPMTVRATPPFGGDSDLVDDDPTSAGDVDAATFEQPFTVIAADATGALSAAPGVVFVDDAGTDDLPLSMSLLSAGALSNAVVTLPLAPHAGVTITGCDEIDGPDCRLLVGDVSRDVPVTRTVGLRVDGSSSGGLDHATVTGRLTASGGVTRELDPAAVSTAGVIVTIATDEIDVSGAEMAVDVTVTGLPGTTTDVTLAPADGRPFALDACHRADSSTVTTTAVGDGWALGAVAPTDTVTCTLRRAVVDADRTDASTAVRLAVGMTAVGGTADRATTAVVPTRSMQVSALTPSTAPDAGYGLDGTGGRPTTTQVSFDVVVRDDVPPSSAPVFGGADPITCRTTTVVGTTRFDCVGEHTITQGDLDTGSYTWRVDVEVDGFDPVIAELEVPTLHADLELTVTELSTPKWPDGYRIGDEVRLLVQIRNRGTLALELRGVAVPDGVRVLRYEVTKLAVRAPAVESLDNGCLTQIELDPGETLDCGLVVEVLDPTGGGTFDFGVEASYANAAFALSVPVDPTTVPAPDDELPPTGAGSGALISCALALVAVGVVMTRAARRNRPTVAVDGVRAR